MHSIKVFLLDPYVGVLNVREGHSHYNDHPGHFVSEIDAFAELPVANCHEYRSWRLVAAQVLSEGRLELALVLVLLADFLDPRNLPQQIRLLPLLVVVLHDLVARKKYDDPFGNNLHQTVEVVSQFSDQIAVIAIPKVEIKANFLAEVFHNAHLELLGTVDHMAAAELTMKLDSELLFVIFHGLKSSGGEDDAPRLAV